MKAIVSVVGKDRIGIIAGICTTLAESNANVLDISQTILNEYFNMIMIISCEDSTFNEVQKQLKVCGEKLGVEVRAQREEIFDAMHRI